MNNLLTMKQACKATGMSYEALKFYCNEGLVPNVKRAENNYRVFDEHDVNWIRRPLQASGHRDPQPAP